MAMRQKTYILQRVQRYQLFQISRKSGFHSPSNKNLPSNSNINWPTCVTGLAGGASCLFLLSGQVRPKSTATHLNDSKPGLFDFSASKTEGKLSDTAETTGESSDPNESENEWKFLGWEIPRWASAVPGFLNKLQDELAAKPGTLADEIWTEAQDPKVHPEIAREAKVRVSNELCEEEKRFLANRKIYVKTALSKYLDIPEKDIHADDVPVIGMCGSGGGLRALVAGTSSYYSAQEVGLYDCVTYTAGVSGSCWLQTLYYSTIVGQDYTRLLDHLKSRIGTHIAFPPPILKLLTSSPTHKYLLSGGYEKYRGYESTDFGLVDLYGVLLGGRLLVPKGDLAIDDRDLKISSQRSYLCKGQNPLPIYTAVRHEIPVEAEENASKVALEEKAKQEAYFQWFEFTPYELWCEEFAAGIPTWSVGREWDRGRSKTRDNGLALPEIRVPLLMGIFGSAFCATLSHYYNEIRPLVRGITGLGGLDEALRQRDDDLVKLHPVEPAAIPNFLTGMGKDRLPDSCPESIHSTERIELMDAGMSNNLPIYPLLRPGRDVDIVIAFDASADIKDDNWLRVTDGYARQRGISGWPIGTGWPTDQELDEADGNSLKQTNDKTEKASESQGKHRDKEQNAMYSKSAAEKVSEHESTELGYCNIWIGSKRERVSNEEPPKSKLVQEDWELMTSDAGITVIYFPFMANPKVEGVDPNKSDFMSTWNFIYTPEQIDNVVSLARQNFSEGSEQVKMAVRAVYERKRKQRLEREEKENASKRQKWTIAKW